MLTASRIDSGRAAELFHALSDQIRVDVVVLLLQGERCVCELMAELDLAQSRLSWHLKTLSDAGVIVGRREGRWNYYSLNPNAFAEARTILDGLKPSRRLAVQRVMQGETTASCCGSSGCCGSTTESWDPITSNLYDEGQTAGVPAEALLASLGCGNPTALAALHEGETVLDLGSGGGIDVLLSAKRVRVAGSPFRMWWFVARHRMKSNATWSADLIVGTEARI